MYRYFFAALIIIAFGVWIYRKISRRQPESKLPKSDLKGFDAYTMDDHFNQTKKARQEELDLLLDKVAKYGIDHLSEREKKRLKELSQS